MGKSAFDNIIIKLPTDTKVVNYVTGEDNTISEVVVNDLGSVIQTNDISVNILLNCVLACFGVDLASVARTAVALNDYRIVDMREILMNSKWEITNVTIGSITHKAMDWIKLRFHIYSKENFINSLFARINDCLLSADNSGVNECIIKLDMNTYYMIKFIAQCLNADHNFTSVPIGEPTVIPNQRYSTKAELEEILHKLFVAQGLTTEEATVTIPDSMWSGSSEVWHYLNQGNYATVLIHKGKCDNPLNVVYPTDPNFHDMWAFNIIVSEEPITALTLNGWTNVSSDNYCIKYSGTSQNDLYGFQTTYNITTSGTYHLFTIMKAFEYLTSENVLNLNYKANSWFRWGDYDSREETPIIICLPYQWYRLQGTHTWTNIQTAQDIVTDIYLNCSYSDEEDVPAPNIDDTILSDIDSLDLLIRNSIATLTLGLDSILEALRTRLNLLDTTTNLKTDLIDINNGLSRVSGKPSTVIKEDADTDYIYDYKTPTIFYRNFGNDTAKMRPFSMTYVLTTVDMINTFCNVLFTKDYLTKVIEGLSKFDPIDCIKEMFILPYNLSPAIKGENDELIGDYYIDMMYAQLGGYSMENIPYTDENGLPATYDCMVHRLKNLFKVLRTDPKPIGIKTQDGEDVYDPVTYLNYEPYTSATIYIPFVGDCKLEMSKVMYKYVYIEYVICQFTGDFIATVYAYDYNDALADGKVDNYGMIGSYAAKKAYPVLTAKGNMAFKIPLIGRKNENILASIAGGIFGVGKGTPTIESQPLGNSFGGLKTSPDATMDVISSNYLGATGIVAGATANAVVSAQGNMVVNGSSYGDVFNLMCNWEPYITIFKHEAIKGYTSDANTAFKETIGKISERGIAIKNMGKGFHKCKGVKVEGLRTTAKIAKMVEEILLSGFYKSTGKEE